MVDKLVSLQTKIDDQDSESPQRTTQMNTMNNLVFHTNHISINS